MLNIDERSYLVPPTQEFIGDALELSVPHAVSAEPSVRRGLIRLNPCGVGRERDIDELLDEIQDSCPDGRYHDSGDTGDNEATHCEPHIRSLSNLKISELAR